MSTPPVPDEHPLMRRNLRLLPWWWVLRWAWLGEGIWVLYLTDERGVTLGQALLFEALYSAVVIATELPTGMIADRFGRRLSLLLGTVAVGVGFVTFGTGTSLLVLLSAYVFLGIGETSFSGADSAMLYDTLKAQRRERDFTVWYGRLNALVTGAIAAFTVAGSLMVRWTPLGAPFLVSAALTIPAVAVAWFFTEPPRTDERHPYLETGRRALSVTRRTPAIFWAMVLMAATTVAIASMAVLQQHFLRDAGIALWAVGLFVAAQMALASVGSWIASPVGRRLTLRHTFWLMPAGSAVALLAAAPGSVWLYPAFIFPALGWTVMYPHFTEYLARRVEDSVRASVISIANVVSGLASVVIVPLTGLSVDRLGFRPAITLLALGLTVGVVLAYLAWRRAGDIDDREDSTDGEGGAPDVSPGIDASTGPTVPSEL